MIILRYAAFLLPDIRKNLPVSSTSSGRFSRY